MESSVDGIKDGYEANERGKAVRRVIQVHEDCPETIRNESFQM